ASRDSNPNARQCAGCAAHHHEQDGAPTLADLTATPALAAEVESDRISERLGEMDRRRGKLGPRRPHVIVDPQCSSATSMKARRMLGTASSRWEVTSRWTTTGP